MIFRVRESHALEKARTVIFSFNYSDAHLNRRARIRKKTRPFQRNAPSEKVLL